MEEILDWLEGHLSTADSAAVRARCEAAGPAVRQQAEWVRWFLDNASRVPLEAPPPLLAQRLRRLAGQRRGPVPPPRRVTAELALDTRSADHLTGVRAPRVADDERYQLTYRAGDVDVVLDISRDGPATVRVRGQVLADRDALPVFEAAAHGPFGSIRSILGDELGGFDLAAVPDTVTAMSMTNDQILVELTLPAGDDGP
jgi:hypothetical protein